MYQTFRFKIILFLLLNTNIVAFAENNCTFKIDNYEKILSNKYDKELENYTLTVANCESIKDSDESIIVKIYRGPRQEDKEDIFYKTLVAVINTKSKIVKNSHLFTSIKNKESIEFYVSIDTKSYKDISSSYAFHVGISYMETHGGSYTFYQESFIYETDNNDIKTMFQNLNTSSFSYYDRSQVQLSRIDEGLNKNIKLTPYGTLEFSREYYYEYLPEGGGEHKSWTVILDEPKKYVYKNGRYEVINKSFSPVFDLKKIEMNTKNGLKYKEIVLRAMLYENPVDKNNIAIYKSIASNLKHSKCFAEYHYLEKELSRIEK